MIDPTYILFAMVTASLALYFVLLMRLKPSTEVKLYSFIDGRTGRKKRRLPKFRKPLPPPPDESVPREPREKECPHYIGYLTTLPKGTSFPEECFGCRKVIRCMRLEPANAIESFYLGAAKPEEAAQ